LAGFSLPWDRGNLLPYFFGLSHYFINISIKHYLTQIWLAIKKCVAVQLGDIYDSQATYREQGGLPVKTPPASLLLVAWKSCMTLSQSEYTKTPPQTGGSFYFLIKKSLKN
jgi:hypothetical protein